MRNIPNSGYYLRPTFLQPLCCPVTHLSVYLLFLFGGIASHTSRLFMSNPFLSVCRLCASLLATIPGYSPTRMSYPCWEHVSLLPPLTPSSSHTGCLMAPSTTCCMKAPVSTTTPPVAQSVPVTVSFVFGRDLWFIALSHLLLCCHHFFVQQQFHCHLLCGEGWLKPVHDLSPILCLDFVVDQTQAVKFALDIACGMAFLHTLEPMIPRLYLNSKSVMVIRSCGFKHSFQHHKSMNRPMKENCRKNMEERRRRKCFLLHLKVTS